jgi:glycine cleavage system H protein
MEAPRDLRYTKTHEWVRMDGDIATVGLSDYAQNELGDITYLELPDVGDSFKKADPFGVIESVKAASDIYMPLDGEIVERNEAAVDAPDVVNTSPYDRAWLVRVKVDDPAQISDLMDASEYDQYAESATGH